MAATKYSQLIKEDSRTYLTTALLQLLQTTDLSEIKVSQLVKRAGVSRMAFYRNFETLDDVLRAYFEPQLNDIFDHVIGQVPADEKLLRLGQFLVSVEDALQLAVKRHYEDIIRQAFFDNMARFYANDDRLQNLPAAKRHYWISFMSAGVYNIWREWLLGGKKDSLEELHQLLGALQNATFQALSE